ncbi:MAG: hypoxanthine-guanine phosphoribosyltransferase [Betaproteobacteria bacterium]|nr:hypoxanthine-guanine phosphoribosyltransferase [Betaproteobacteria bacterium]
MVMSVTGERISRPDPATVLAQSDCLADSETVRAAIARVAERINADLADQVVKVCPLLNGSLPFAGMLVPQLRMPLRLDAIKVSRYGYETRGKDLEWLSPIPDVQGETVLLLDDVLDAGVTLTLVRGAMLSAGARRCLIAVLTEKNCLRPKPIEADYVALEMPDRYIFGMGMDVFGWWRNLPAIHAMREVDGP